MYKAYKYRLVVAGDAEMVELVMAFSAEAAVETTVTIVAHIGSNSCLVDSQELSASNISIQLRLCLVFGAVGHARASFIAPRALRGD
jgi:hypothetical protein